jgi:hypothetical protein
MLLMFLAIAIGGAYAAYYPYKHIGNFVGGYVFSVR